MLHVAGFVLITVSVSLLIWPTKHDPENPEEKVRDWPAIVGCFIGGVIAFKLWWMLLNVGVQMVSPVGKVRTAGVGMQMLWSGMQSQSQGGFQRQQWPRWR
jgi:hypothetical protein